jgi:hypothetical protein
LSLTEKAGKFVLAVGLVTVIASLSITLVGLVGSGFALSSLSFGEFGMVWLGYMPVLVPFVTLAGLLALPLSALMVKSGLNGLAAYAVIGALAGAAVSTLVFVILSIGSVTNVPVWAAVGLLPGLAAGLFWWETVIRRDRLGGAPA